MDIKDSIMEATMQIVSESGINSFDTSSVTSCLGITKEELEKYYSSKEKLLLECFEDIHGHVVSFFKHISDNPVDYDEIDTEEFIIDFWSKYFDLLINNSYRTLYYYTYRESAYYRSAVLSDELNKEYALEFQKFIRLLSMTFPKLQHMNHHIVWTYFIDVTGLFARRLINGEIEDNEPNRYAIASMIFKGIGSFM